MRNPTKTDLVFCEKMSSFSAANQFLGRTWDRDRILAVVQFLTMTLDGPLAAMGNKDLHASVTKLGVLTDVYRTVTRFSCLLDFLSPEKVKSVLTVSDPTARRLGLFEYVTQVIFFPLEHLSLLAKQGILSSPNGNRFGPLAVFFWFWTLLFSQLRQMYQMLLAYPQLSPKATDTASVKRQAEWTKMVQGIIRNTCFLIFSLTCLPEKGKPQLLLKPAGLLLPLHRAVEVLSPPHLALSLSLRGVLGLIASSVGFF